MIYNQTTQEYCGIIDIYNDNPKPEGITMDIKDLIKLALKAKTLATNLSVEKVVTGAVITLVPGAMVATGIYIVGNKLVKKYKASKVDQAESVEVEEAFNELAAAWKEETKFISSMSEITSHWAYQRIIAMGPVVVPLILKDLKKEGNHWFAALTALTGENPIAEQDAGIVSKMREAWLQWEKDQDLTAVAKVKKTSQKVKVEAEKVLAEKSTKAKRYTMKKVSDLISKKK